MGRISWEEIRLSAFNSPPHKNLYGVVISGIKDADLKAVWDWLKRYCKNNTNVGWQLVDSTHVSKKSEPVFVHNHKVGRPRRVVIGKTTLRHLHILLVSTDNSDASGIAKEALCNFLIKLRQRKEYLKRQSSKKLEKGMDIVDYCCRQADHVYRSHNYDWEYFIHYYYYEVDENGNLM